VRFLQYTLPIPLPKTHPRSRLLSRSQAVAQARRPGHADAIKFIKLSSYQKKKKTKTKEKKKKKNKKKEKIIIRKKKKK
jgi:hypothetical protein